MCVCSFDDDDNHHHHNNHDHHHDHDHEQQQQQRTTKLVWNTILFNFLFSNMQDQPAAAAAANQGVQEHSKLIGQGEKDQEEVEILEKGPCSCRRVCCALTVLVLLAATVLMLLLSAQVHVDTWVWGENEVSLLGESLLDDSPMNCSKHEVARFPVGTYARLVKEADCGLGYPYEQFVESPARNSVTVALYGDNIQRNLYLSGCRPGRHCPYHPRCTFKMVSTKHSNVLKTADVFVATSEEIDDMADIVHFTKSNKKMRRVLYWREPYWKYLDVPKQRKYFHTMMGVFWSSGIVNPNYLRRPHTLLKKSFFEALPFQERTHFALSIISNCHSNSRREYYLKHLTAYLGEHRVHRYGRCGNRKLPPPPVNNAAKVISKYKFYLSFENSIMDGYVSEKLFTVLNMNLLPVYLGGEHVLNITNTPSYIHVFDFRSPKDLAMYLLYLESNPVEYNKYHEWRKSPNSFHDQYLNIVKDQFPGQIEASTFKKHQHGVRLVACCRLCNLNFLDHQIAKRTDDDLVRPRVDENRINKHLYSGMLHSIPGKKAMLTPPEPDPALQLDADDYS